MMDGSGNSKYILGIEIKNIILKCIWRMRLESESKSELNTVNL